MLPLFVVTNTETWLFEYNGSRRQCCEKEAKGCCAVAVTESPAGQGGDPLVCLRFGVERSGASIHQQGEAIGWLACSLDNKAGGEGVHIVYSLTR